MPQDHFTETGFSFGESHYDQACDQLEVLDRTTSKDEFGRYIADAREDLKIAIATLRSADSKASQLQDTISVFESERRTVIATLKAKIDAMNIELANERSKAEALTNAIQGLEDSLQAEKADKERIQAQEQQVSLKLEDLRRNSGYLEPRPNDSVHIMLISFGGTFITKPEVVDRCYQYAHTKNTFRFDPSWFHGIDPMPGVEKMAFIFYKYNNTGPIRCLYSIEHKDVRFDLK